MTFGDYNTTEFTDDLGKARLRPFSRQDKLTTEDFEMLVVAEK